MSIPDFIHHFATFNPLPPQLSQSQRCAKIAHYRCQSALVRLHRTHLQGQDEMWEWKEMEGCVERRLRRNLVNSRMPSSVSGWNRLWRASWRCEGSIFCLSSSSSCPRSPATATASCSSSICWTSAHKSIVSGRDACMCS